MVFVFFFRQKTAYEMRISDWSSTGALPISPALPKNPMAPPRRGWAARTTGEARASGGVHPEGRNEMEQLGEAGLAARRGGPSRERRPDPPRGRPNHSTAAQAAPASTQECSTERWRVGTG